MILKAGFHFSVCFFLLFLFHEDDQSSSPAPDVFPILFICLSIYVFLFTCHHAVVVVLVVVVTLTGFVLKRLFASVATVCFEVDTSAVNHHRFFLGYYTAILNTSKVIEIFEAHPTLATPARRRSCRHFSLPWCTPYVNVKLSGACAELKITYQLYGLSIRNPIRKVRIAEPL